MSYWEDYLEEQQPRFLEELLEFLRIPSISSLPECAADVERAAEWVAARLERAGIEGVRILPTDGHPLVYGEWLHREGAPTALIYGHFDTQPADPLELWDHPPFEPHRQDGRVYARGASDDKGNMLAPILAVEALISGGMLPLNLKFLFEGQEEIGSPQLPGFIASHQELLACDLMISADGSQWREEQPAVLLGLRGICALQVDVRGARSDLHSGGHGGALQNPIHALVSLLDSLHDQDGHILVEGFYDDVRPLSEEERALIAAVPFDEGEYRERLGISATFGEAGYTTLERIWARPTLEINGIWGGFQGEGTKTVLPSEAHAKITCRLVADQEPKRILGRVTAHLQRHAPPGVTVSITEQDSFARPYLMPADHPGNRVAAEVLRELYGRAPHYTRTGGSIPICRHVQDTLGVYTVNFAFGLSDENAHAPNEFFRLASFRRAQRGYCLLLERLSRADLGS